MAANRLNQELRTLYTPEQLQALDKVRGKLLDDPQFLDSRKGNSDGNAEEGKEDAG